MEQPKKNVVGIRIQRIRNSRGISQQYLSNMCARMGYEITRSTLAKIEAGIRSVSDAELFVIAKALDLKIDELFPLNFEKTLRANKIAPLHTRRGGS